MSTEPKKKLGLARRLLPAVTAVICLPALAPIASAASHMTKDQHTGLLSWQAEKGGFSLSLQQLRPDNISAMYEGMGASQTVVKRIAAYCVFGTDAKNLGSAPISYNVASWRAITPDGVHHRLRTKVGWQKIWKKLGVDYGLTIFPAAQTFQPGDWGEGFTTIKLPPETKFNLSYTWSEHGKTYKGTMVGLQCAADR